MPDIASAAVAYGWGSAGGLRIGVRVNPALAAQPASPPGLLRQGGR
ncbi:hypothetical protein [Nocardia beijingensis]|nr:hypothetical protein [Nocardia beijingensis]